VRIFLLAALFIPFCFIGQGQRPFPIVNTGKVEYSPQDVDNIVSVCAGAGITAIDQLTIGIYLLPGGLNSNLVSVSNKPSIKDGYNVTQRSVRLVAAYWKSAPSSIKKPSEQFTVYSIDTVRIWWVFSGTDTIRVVQRPGVSYREVSDIVTAITENRYVFTRDNGNHSLRDDIKRLNDIDVVDNRYQVTFSFFGHGYTARCLMKERQLVIEGIVEYVN
jgi:hypothetical protein